MYNDEVVEEKNNSTGIIHGYVEEVTSIKYPFDICLYIDMLSRVSEGEQHKLIDKIWHEIDNFSFPKKVCGNRKESSCQKKWFNLQNDDDRKWLRYSPTLDSLFCLYCLMFPYNSGQDSNLSSKVGLSSWPSATSKLKLHINNNGHKKALEQILHIKQTMKDPTKAINVMMNKAQSELIKRNRAQLIPIIASVIYLGRQGLAFRGHRDDSKYLSDPNNNPGNFQALLGLLQDQSPEVRSLFDDAPRNATYHSKTIQNQIIDVIGDMIAERIIKEVKNAQFFSILADEASDISNKEQLSLVLRFVDENNEIREEFICFLHCDSGLSGESLAKLIMDKTHELGLSMDKCRGQGYDGAGSMVGRVKGVAARISAIYKFAVYTHCFSHALNLSVMRIINVKYVKEMFDNCKVISKFFNNSPKRYELFSTILKQTVPDATISTKLITLCRTYDGLKDLKEFRGLKNATKLPFLLWKELKTTYLYMGLVRT